MFIYAQKNYQRFLKSIYEKAFIFYSCISCQKLSRKSEKKMVQNSKVIKTCQYQASQSFQSPILLRDPEETNHTQNKNQGGKVELGLQLQLFTVYI